MAKTGLRKVAKPTEEMRSDLWFHIYHGLGGERSLTSLRQYGIDMSLETPSLRTLARWSKDHGWQARIEEMGAKVRARREEREVDAIEELNRRQGILGSAMQNVGARVIDEINRADGRRGEVGLRDAARVVEIGAKLERLAKGAATDRQELVVSLWTVVINEIAALFVTVNTIEDPEIRKKEFAHGVDEIAERHAAAALSEGR